MDHESGRLPGDHVEARFPRCRFAAMTETAVTTPGADATAPPTFRHFIAGETLEVE